MTKRKNRTAYIVTRNMAAGILACLVLLSLVSTKSMALSAVDITAESAILMDAATGQILFQKDMNRQMYPASITKIMTGLLVMEYCSPREIITVSNTAVSLPAGSSHIALSAGERLTVDDAMYALMLPSANDAANALAEHVSGSQAAFAELMNRRAHEIGVLNTRFTNAHGLPDNNHVTTAYDMALITREAMKSARFMTYFGADRHVMPATNLAEERPFTNYQHMLVEDTHFYNADAVAGKVGYTRLAGHTMSTIATQNGRTLICVVMNTGKDQKFYDTQKLLDFGFDEFAPFTVGRDDIRGEAYLLEGGGPAVSGTPLEGETIELLVHQNSNPADITFGYDYLAYPDGGQDTPGYISLSAPVGEESMLSHSLFITLSAADITWFEPLAATHVAVPPSPGLNELPAKLWDYVLAGFILTLMAGGIFAAIYCLIADFRQKRT